MDRLVDLATQHASTNLSPRRSYATLYALFSIIKATDFPMTPQSSCSSGTDRSLQYRPPLNFASETSDQI